MSLLPASIKRIGSKTIEKRWRRWSNFDDDLIKNEGASMETPFSHYKSMGNFLDLKGRYLRSQWSDLAEIQTRPRFYTCPCYLQSIKRIRSKTTEKRWKHHFPHYKSMGAFCGHGNQSFDLIFPKTLSSLSPTPMKLRIKFDQDWPTRFRDIQVWKCGRRRTDDDDDGRTTDHRYTISSPCEPSAQVS